MANSSIIIPQIDTLITGLPNDLSALILSYIPYPFHDRLKSTCKSWRKFYSSNSPVSLRQTHLSLSSLSDLICIFPEDPSLTSPYLFDPTHLAWAQIPPIPINPHVYSAWAQIPPIPINPHVYSLSNFASLTVGPHLYVLGGSQFDTRSFPLERLTAVSEVWRFDFGLGKWTRVSSMRTPRGSLAAAVGKGVIYVAGGWSRHTMFGAAGSRVGSAEVYDIERDEWGPLDQLPGSRAGCVGFCVGGGREFWVMGGYGEARNGVLPVDEYYKDVVVLEVKDGGGGGGGGGWREIGDMWEEKERARLGKVVVIDNDGYQEEVFMLDGNDIFRYNMVSNRWCKESTVPRKTQDGSQFGFVALQGELNVISLLQGVDLSAIQRSRHRKRDTALFMQIYNPRNMSWRSLVTQMPFPRSIDFETAVMCTLLV